VRRTPDDTDACATVIVHELGAEELVVQLAERLGRRHDGHLFALCSLLELCRVNPPMDGARIAKLATDGGVELDVAAGIDIVRGTLHSDGGSTADALEEALALLPHVTTPRVLTWARHGPEVFGRRPELRAAYMWALCLLSVEGARHRVAYVRRSLIGGKRHEPVLTRIVLALVPRLLKRRRDDPPDVPVYWLDPDPASTGGGP
jgi:hypothetical protein